LLKEPRNFIVAYDSQEVEFMTVITADKVPGNFTGSQSNKIMGNS